ncbi:MAG: thioredoxin family protein [Bacilli bacterium]
MQLIRISAIWCPACLIMRPRVDKLKEIFPSIEHIEYDYDFDDEVKNYNVGSKLPVFILMDGSCEITRIIGEKSILELETILKGCI